MKGRADYKHSNSGQIFSCEPLIDRNFKQGLVNYLELKINFNNKSEKPQSYRQKKA